MTSYTLKRQLTFKTNECPKSLDDSQNQGKARLTLRQRLFNLTFALAMRVGPIAQSVEQRTFNPWVDGSSPSGPTIFSLDF